MKHLAITLMVLFLSACAANPFSQFYYDQTGGIDLTTLNTVILPGLNEKPILYRGNTPEEDRIKMLENGYGIVGYSSFNAGNVNENDVFVQAKKVHASVIVLYSQYTNTVSGSLPLTLPDNQTSTTSAYGSVYGSGGYGTYTGSATTTTYGTKTTYIPYSVRRYDYSATYWIKMKEPRIGTYVVDLDADKRAEIQSNKGMLIEAVIKNSPAYRSDIFRGDILRKIGDVDIYDGKSFQEALEKYAGQTVSVIIYRDGEIIEKQIQLNNPV